MNEANRTDAPYAGSYRLLFAFVGILLLTIFGLMAAGVFQIVKWMF